MESVDATFTWPGPKTDVLRLYVEPTPALWDVEVVDGDVVLFRALDEREKPTQQFAGLEIIGFLTFDRWDDLPDLGLRWRLPGQRPLPLVNLLKQLQAEFRVRATALALA